MSKSFRHGQILKLIRSQRISTQEELAQELKKHGIAATQVTLSRDLRELRLVKTPDGYRELGEAGESEPGGRELDFEALASEFLQDVRIAQNLLVLETAPGHANSVAVALDDAAWAEVVGTIAGDDTILVVTPDNDTARRLREKLMTIVSI